MPLSSYDADTPKDLQLIGAITRQAADLLRKADAICIDELRRHHLHDRFSQSFAIFLPVNSVAAMGDGRRYDLVDSLQAVETLDTMTAHWAHLPYELLNACSHRIVNEVKGVSHVVYDVSGKLPATIEWE